MPPTRTPPQQLELASALERSQPVFFELLRRHTMESYYGSPRHGGNRDAVSWRMLGLDEPPLRGRAQYDFTSRPQIMKSVNAVIIGAGAAGGIVAKELAVAGLGVVLLERGKWYTPHDCRKDDLRNQRTTSLGNAFGPDDDGNPRVIVDGKGIARQVLPSEGAYQNNAACVGGGTLSYGAQAWRYMPQDFRMRTTYGAPEGSSLEDWPISYDDLEPFYEKAEYEIGISGDYSPTPFKGPRRRPLPMPPLPPNREFGILQPAARRLGLHPFPLPMARNSVPYNGRGPCMRCRWCCGFACEADAKNGSQNTVIPVALATGNCELRTECMVNQIVTDDRGRARSVLYVDPHGKRQEQPADIVIVSACAIESARLLLNSKSRLFPQGLGNRYDQVGRNLARPSLHRRHRLFRLRHLRRPRPRRQHRHLRLQPRHAGPLRRRHARQ